MVNDRSCLKKLTRIMAAMNPAVKALLDSAGIDSNLEDVPAQYAVAPNPLAEVEDFTMFNTEPIRTSAGEAPSSKTDTEKYWHIRQYFIQEGKAKNREQVVAKRLPYLQETVRSGDTEAINELFKKRHVWRMRASEFCTDQEKICKNERCTHIAVPGSDYCTNHILQDEKQMLFAECPECHRPYPKMSRCFACRK